MKKPKNLKKLLDLEKIDISILNDSEKQVIHGGYNSQGCTSYTTPCTQCPVPSQACHTDTNYTAVLTYCITQTCSILQSC